MTRPSTYPNATAFRQALETRLNNLAQAEGIDIQRLRRQVAFDRLLCRLFHNPETPWALKGGYAMELRLQATRTTRDIDLAWRSKLDPRHEIKTASRLREALQEAAAVDLADHFVFLIGAANMDLNAAPYGGGRYPVEARMSGRVFARFHVDVAVGDCVIDPLEQIGTQDWLGFAGIPKRSFPAISREQQFAEKLHAYTLPRSGALNTRVRDLIDMLLLCRMKMDLTRTGDAISATFERRATHSIPPHLEPPPTSWELQYTELATECRLSVTMDQAFSEVKDAFSKMMKMT